MPRRNPPAKWVLPDVVNPPDRLCFMVPVPNDRKHIGAFFGALFNLTSARFWQDDPDHTALAVAQVWRDIFDELRQSDCNPVCPVPISEMEYEMSICEQLRFQDGKLQGLCCGEWVDIAGQGDIVIGGPGQQGGDQPQPVPGGCLTYHAQFSAKSQYNVPTAVSAGDTLTFSNPQGSGHDGTVSPWKCPNGQTFFAGQCIGLGGTSGTDPAPAIDHMALIALIGGVYYPAFSGTITVPAGVVNAEIIIQTNDSNLDDNSGSYALDIEVCNNAVATSYSHLFNFVSGPNGWQVQGSNGAGWSAGAFRGLVTITSNENRIYLDFPAGTSITAFSVKIDTESTLGGGVEVDQYTGPGTTGTGTLLYSQGLANGSTANRNATVAASIAVTGLAQSLLIQSSGEVIATYNDIFSVTLSGNGPDPF